MHNRDILEKNILRDLGDGLILRRNLPQDSEALADFNARIFLEENSEEPNEQIRAWTSDLATQPHPTCQPDDFTIVEDTNTGKIVSTLVLISQTWSYAGIPFGVGRPELVATLPEYRNRGLVRAQFEVLHQWSAERGHLVQGITGIPYFYRLFDYEMVVSLGGGRAGFLPHVPRLKDGDVEPYVIRPAEETDLAFIHELYQHGCRRSLVSAVMDEDLWRYELLGKSDLNVNRMALKVIVDLQGERVGFYAHPPVTWGTMMPANLYEIKPGLSWAAVTPSVIRSLIETGNALLKDKPDKTTEAFGFWHGIEHPVYQAIKDRLPRIRKPYAWYIRVPDLPGFLRHITPVLESRLAESPVSGHTGEIKITFYRSGLKLVLQEGKITKVEPWKPEPVGNSGDAAFPGLTFLQIVFGHRSLDELNYMFPDCWVENDDTRSVLEALFPQLPSNITPIS
jgi:hypothetical protein